jgi:hypothetical protein
MKHFKLSLVALTILILGCGGGSNDSTPAANADDVKTVVEAEKNFNAFSALKSLDTLSLDSLLENTKTLSKTANHKVTNQKTTTIHCSNGGTQTITVSDDETTNHVSFNHCKEEAFEANGEMTLVYQDNGNMHITYKDVTIINEEGRQYMNFTMQFETESSAPIVTISIDGIVNQTTKSGEKNNIKFSNFILKDKETEDESWSTLNGTIAVESKCTTGTYTFETIEKLVDATDGSDNLESGILKLNGATYTFDNPYVTIKAGNQEETITQSELERRMSHACAI